MEKYNHSKNLITKIIESKFPFQIKSPVISAVVKMGFIPNLLFIIFWFLRYKEITPMFLVSYLFLLIWVNLGPYLIWHYDEILLPQFFKKVFEIIPDEGNVKKLATKYDNIFSEKFWIATIPWIFIIIIVYFNSLSGLKSGGGILGIGDFVFWVGLLGIIWLALLTSIGFWGVLTTILAIREISKSDLHIDPLHPDKLGGLSCIGYYAIGTTILFSSGALFLPVFFQLVANIKESTSYFLYFAVLVFSFFILLSFLYPTLIVNNKAKVIRRGILNKLRKQYRDLSMQLKSNNQNHIGSLVTYHELNHIRNEYLDYKTVKLYPFETDIFVKLVGSVILPFIFILIQRALN